MFAAQAGLHFDEVERQPVREAFLVFGEALRDPGRGAFADGDEAGFHESMLAGRRQVLRHAGRFHSCCFCSSFPRRRESSDFGFNSIRSLDPRLRGDDGITSMDPACAGMTSEKGTCR